MSMDATFHEAILQNPDDDAPRLAYADWLEERGDPRGEFIRVQCQLAEWDSEVAHLRDYTRWTQEADKGLDRTGLIIWLCELAEHGKEKSLRQDLREREQALLDEFAETWTKPFRSMLSYFGDTPFRWGMIERVNINSEDLLIHADELFRQFPLQTIWLSMNGRPREAPDVLALPHLNRLRNLDVYVGGEKAPGGLGNALASAASLANLSRLAVTDGYEQVSDADVVAIANSPHFSDVRVLQLPHNDIGLEGTRALAVSPYLRNLDFLSLAQNPLGSAGLAALADSPNFSTLTILDLWDTRLDDGIQALAHSRRLGKLRALFLDGNYLETDSGSALASSPYLESLVVINLADSDFGLDGFRILTDSPLFGRLQTLNLTRSVIEEADEAAEFLADLPSAAELRILGLSNNEMTDRGALALASSPHLENMWRLGLHSNNFTEVGKDALEKRFGERWRSSWADRE